MIISFYDRQFNGLQNNASLTVDNKSYSLIRRGVEMDELKCTCEPFTENIQPAFIAVKNDLGNYVYGCLAGIPVLTAERKTTITGTDLKAMFKSDIVFSAGSYASVNALITGVFGQWNTQVNQGTIACELVFKDTVGTIALGYLDHGDQRGVYNVWDDILSAYLKYYGLYMVASLDLVSKKVIFTVGKSMLRDLNIKLWEHGVYNYGKWVAGVNETQGIIYHKPTESYMSGTRWILRSDNSITTNAGLRDIFPVKRKIILKEADDSNYTEKINEANTEVLERLCDGMYKENIELSGIQADFETKFNIAVSRGEGIYKSLPCGELHYDSSGLTKVQVGYRFGGLQFIL